MPDIERKGVTLSQALQEAAASAPLHRVMLYAYELWHPSMSEPLRFVNDNADLFATLEADAPRDPDTEVEFIAMPVALARPEESDTAANPSVTLERQDVGGVLKEALDAARGRLEPWILIERIYASDETVRPAVLPVATYEISGAELAAMSGAITATYDDDANIAVPRMTFKRSEYPGLQR